MNDIIANVSSTLFDSTISVFGLVAFCVLTFLGVIFRRRILSFADQAIPSLILLVVTVWLVAFVFKMPYQAMGFALGFSGGLDLQRE